MTMAPSLFTIMGLNGVQKCWIKSAVDSGQWTVDSGQWTKYK